MRGMCQHHAFGAVLRAGTLTPPETEVIRWLQNGAPRVSHRRAYNTGTRPYAPTALIVFFDGNIQSTSNHQTDKQPLVRQSISSSRAQERIHSLFQPLLSQTLPVSYSTRVLYLRPSRSTFRHRRTSPQSSSCRSSSSSARPSPSLDSPKQTLSRELDSARRINDGREGTGRPKR